MPTQNTQAIQRAVLAWFDRAGRKHLPWQQQKTPYRVWISEIMLQQTQVATVIDYYQRFMQRFPTLSTLAAAPQDDVLAHWAGLGYYSRARNLHACAQRLQAEHGGEFPLSVDAIAELPGIGRSTAGAILSLGAGHWAPILDGNVKRVLCRVAGIELFKQPRKAEKRLWALSEQLTPAKRHADWNQAMMDIGATVCRRGTPLCQQCPFSGHCVAESTQAFQRYPGKKPKKAVPLKQSRVLMLVDGKRLLLKQRPPTGIWGGLWTLPEIDPALSPVEQAAELGLSAQIHEAIPPLRHTFSHFQLDIHAFYGVIAARASRIMDAPYRWQPLNALHETGLPAPILKLIQQQFPEKS